MAESMIRCDSLTTLLERSLMPSSLLASSLLRRCSTRALTTRMEVYALLHLLR